MIKKIKDIISGAEKFVLATHIDPDGDAIGSCFAFSFALKNLTKPGAIYLKEEVPYKYNFLPHYGEITNVLPNVFDALFVLDCATFSRVGDGYEVLRGAAPIVSIDHHNGSEHFGIVNIIDEEASSTAEILYFLFKDLGIEISYEIAINLYTAILTETGSFRYENTNEKAFFICQEMLKKGIKPSFVARMVYESHPVERFHLLSLVLQTLTLHKGRRVAMVHVTGDMLRRTGAKKEYSDGFVEYLREIKGVEIAILIREIDERTHKISMRSRGSIDVAKMLRKFGGGGHINAAGCIMEGKLGEIKERILEAVVL